MLLMKSQSTGLYGHSIMHCPLKATSISPLIKQILQHRSLRFVYFEDKSNSRRSRSPCDIDIVTSDEASFVKRMAHQTGSGGYQDNYKMEENASKWEVEREKDPQLYQALKEGDKEGDALQESEEKSDPDYKPPEPTGDAAVKGVA